VWNTLLPARAVENQCYVAGSNRTGTDGAGIKYCGESMVVSPKGEIIASAGREENCCINVELFLTELSEFRNRFNVLEDADEFSLGTKV
jgi:predicted amidohydrolase